MIVGSIGGLEMALLLHAIRRTFLAAVVPALFSLTGCAASTGCPKFQELMQAASCPGGAPVEMKNHYSSVLRGRVLSGGVPVEGATVVAEVFDWRVRKTAVSDSQGVFMFEELRPETYRIAICRPGFRPATGFAFIGDAYLEVPLVADLKPDGSGR
jgi:hypothetical protein